MFVTHPCTCFLLLKHTRCETDAEKKVYFSHLLTRVPLLSLQQAVPLMRTQTLACVNTGRAKRTTLTGS